MIVTLDKNYDPSLDYFLKVPDDLLVHILSFLPLSEISSKTLVCRKWKKIINSERFLNLAAKKITLTVEPNVNIQNFIKNIIKAGFIGGSKEYLQKLQNFFEQTSKDKYSGVLKCYFANQPNWHIMISTFNSSERKKNYTRTFYWCENLPSVSENDVWNNIAQFPTYGVSLRIPHTLISTSKINQVYQEVCQLKTGQKRKLDEKQNTNAP